MKPFNDSTRNEILSDTMPGALNSHDQTPFFNVTVKDILWGMESPLLEMSIDPKGLFKNRPDLRFPHDKFGIFVGKNGTNPGIMTSKGEDGFPKVTEGV